MLLEQAVLAKAFHIVENILKFYMDNHNVVAAADAVSKCGNIAEISQGTCNRLMLGLLENSNFDRALVVAVYMIGRDYTLPQDSVYFVLSGLMRNSRGVKKSLDLIKVLY